MTLARLINPTLNSTTLSEALMADKQIITPDMLRFYYPGYENFAPSPISPLVYCRKDSPFPPQPAEILVVNIQGPGSVGKNTMIKGIVGLFPDIARFTSATNRPQDLSRRQEDIQDHDFVPREIMAAMIARGDLLEFVELSGYLYGMPKDTIDKVLLSDPRPQSALLEVDVHGYPVIRDYILEEHPQVAVLDLLP